jgi:hypothetical protein
MMQAIVHTESLQALAEKMKDLLPGGTGYDSMMRVAADKMLASVKQRIHANGLASDGSDIGTYSVKPMYISTVTGAATGLLQPAGKTGKSVFSTGRKKGQAHTSAYLAGGYAEFKSALGLSETGNVNLFFTGELCNRLTVIGHPTGTGYGLGWQNEQYQQRALALEAKYGKPIWALTEGERSEAINVLTCECINVLK